MKKALVNSENRIKVLGRKELQEHDVFLEIIKIAAFKKSYNTTNGGKLDISGKMFSIPYIGKEYK